MKLVLWLLPILMGRSSGTTKTQRDKDKDKDTNDESKLDVRRLMDNCGRGNFDYVKEQADKFGNKTVIEAKDKWKEGCLIRVVANWRKIRCQGHAETCQKQRLDLLKFLVDNGADIDEIHSSPVGEYSALGFATEDADVPVMKLLLDGGANIEFRDNRDKRTPIFYTNKFKSRNQKEGFSAMSLLLKYGAEIDARDKYNETVLAMAIRQNRPDWVLELLKNGASFEIAKASYETAEASYETAKASFKTANASYETAEASFKTAQASYETAEASFETATASFETAKALFKTAKASFETAKASFEAAKDIKYDKENSVDYTEVRAEDGTAFATSTFNRYYRPEQAFKILGAGDKTYWCSKYNPVQPVSLWFQFKEPKCVTKIEFNEKYSLPSGKVYQVFASNALGNCESPSQMTIICDGTAEVFAGGKEFVNNQTFYCYGLRTYDQSARNYVAVKRLQFGVKASFETAKASLETAKASLETANATLETAKPSFKTAKASFETAKASFETPKASFETATASLETAKASLKTAQDIKYKQSKFEDSMELFEVYGAIWRRIQQAMEGQTLFKTGGAGNGENASKLT